jgi:hypothetical protein
LVRFDDAAGANDTLANLGLSRLAVERLTGIHKEHRSEMVGGLRKPHR